MTRLVLYVAAPLRPTDAEIDAALAVYGGRHRAAATVDALKANIARAMRWLAWLRRSFPEVTFVAPWIAAVLSGEDDSDPAQREAGLVDADAIVPRLDGVVLCGGRISSGMERERAKARRCWDFTRLGDQPSQHPPGVLDEELTFERWAVNLEIAPRASAASQIAERP